MDDLALATEYDRTAELHEQLASRARDTGAAAMHRRTAKHFRDLAADLRQEVREEDEHVGMDGKPCRCTPAARRRATRDCASTCSCHGVKHSKCPDAHPCIGGCGRMTTAGETNACGYCPHCAADARWVTIA